MKIPASTFLRQAVPALALAITLTSCAKSTSVPCSTERACPEGWACSADGQTCIQSLCGDNIVQSGEVCDDGNTVDGDGCNSTCTSNETCGNGYVDLHKGEECDDGNQSNDDNCLDTCQIARCGDGIVSPQSAAKEQCDTGGLSKSCNLNCTIARCGDGLVSPGEECDDGTGKNTTKCNSNCTVAICGDGIVNHEAGEECDNGTKADSAECLSTCKWSRCGDGYVNALVEACDDGNAPARTKCDYGTPTCEACSSDCTARLKLTGPYCGDRETNGNEECDDGNSPDKTACDPGVLNCTACSSACKTLYLTGSVCGNGVPEKGEGCDDGNAESCGSCNAQCKAEVIGKKAQGSIIAIASSALNDGETFTLHDGINEPVTFEFDKNGSTQAGHIPVTMILPQGANAVADILRDVINDVPESRDFEITARREGHIVKLEHQRIGDATSRSSLETVADPRFIVTGMAGGKPYGCSEGVGCASNSDCAVGLACVNNACTEQ